MFNPRLTPYRICYTSSSWMTYTVDIQLPVYSGYGNPCPFWLKNELMTSCVLKAVV